MNQKPNFITIFFLNIIIVSKNSIINYNNIFGKIIIIIIIHYWSMKKENESWRGKPKITILVFKK